jgi:hypothetical protein
MQGCVSARCQGVPERRSLYVRYSTRLAQLVARQVFDEKTFRRYCPLLRDFLPARAEDCEQSFDQSTIILISVLTVEKTKLGTRHAEAAESGRAAAATAARSAT